MRHSILYSTLVAVALLAASAATAQTTQICPAGQAICEVQNGQYLNRVVNGDTTAAGARVRADRVYQLGRGSLYLMDASIRNAGYHLRVYGAEGDGPLPQIYTTVNTTSGNRVGDVFNMEANITFRNFAFSGVIENPVINPAGNATMSVTLVRVNQPGHDLVLDNVRWVNIVAQFVRAQSSLRKFEMTNSVWANSGYLGTNGTNFGAGKGIDLRDGSIDSLIFRNNTFINYTDRIIRHYASTAPVRNMIFDHNTILDAVSYHGTLVLGQVGERIQITNNLFLDSFVAGADSSDIVRQAEFNETGEVYEVNGQPKMAWILSEPNETTNWVVANNVYAVSPAVEAFYALFGDGMGDDGNPDNGTDGDNDIIDEGPPLTDHIMSRISNPNDAFVRIDLEVANRPAPMIDMVTWYRTETGRTKDTATFDEDTDDYNRMTFEYFLNDLDASYPTSSPAYTAAAGGCPAGDLNWFPSDYDRCDGIMVANEGNPASATAFRLANYPNPFSSSTTITYELPESDRVSLTVYNILGQEVATLVSGELQPAGTHNVRWQGTDAQGRPVANGMYIYQLRTNDEVLAKRMVVLN